MAIETSQTRRTVFVVSPRRGAVFLDGKNPKLRERDRVAAAHRPVIGQAAYAHHR